MHVHILATSILESGLSILQIVKLMRTSLTKLSVEQFLEVYQSGGHIWPPQVIYRVSDPFIDVHNYNNNSS